MFYIHPHRDQHNQLLANLMRGNPPGEDLQELAAVTYVLACSATGLHDPDRDSRLVKAVNRLSLQGLVKLVDSGKTWDFTLIAGIWVSGSAPARKPIPQKVWMIRLSDLASVASLLKAEDLWSPFGDVLCKLSEQAQAPAVANNAPAVIETCPEGPVNTAVLKSIMIGADGYIVDAAGNKLKWSSVIENNGVVSSARLNERINGQLTWDCSKFVAELTRLGYRAVKKDVNSAVSLNNPFKLVGR